MDEYLRGKQIYLQLAIKYNCSKRTVQCKINLHEATLKAKEIIGVIILMYTTYWGRKFGVMLLLKKIY
jgi:hypothetical protein